MAGDDEPVDRPEDLAASPDASDPKDLEKRRRRKRGEVRDEAEFWKMVFASPVGRKTMWRVLKNAGTFEVIFAHVNGQAPDSIASWYAAGRRELGLDLYHQWMVANREGVLKMLDEHDPRFQPVPIEQPAAAVEPAEEYGTWPSQQS